jgi:hypothetical protein
MADLQRSLVEMLGENGCDEGLLSLRDAHGHLVDKHSFMFSPTDQMILRQYECGSEPVVLLSKFLQLDVSTSHLVLVHLRARIAQLREPKFAMYAAISHLTMESLTGRTKTEMVLSDAVTDRDEHGRFESMQPCVSRFRLLCAEDLELRCGLVRRHKDDLMVVEDEPALPSDIAVGCLLNPLVGGK